MSFMPKTLLETEAAEIDTSEALLPQPSREDSNVDITSPSLCNSLEDITPTLTDAHTTRLLSKQMDMLYCPSCLENMPSPEARLKKNRCGNCFDCPSCGQSLSTRASSIQGPDPEQPNRSVQRKLYYLACTGCRWTSRDVNIPDQIVATGRWPEQDVPNKDRINALLEHYRAVAQRDKLDRVTHLSTLSPITASRAPVDRNYDLPGGEYPNNLLRNAAVRAVNTPFVLVLEIDMLPSEGLCQHFVDVATKRKLMRRFVFKSRREGYKHASDDLFTANNNAAAAAPPPPFGLDEVFFTPKDKVASVLPAYEIKEEVALPRTKEQLLNLINNGQARLFYDQLFRKCQHPTNYSAWESLPPTPTPSAESSLAAAYEVLWQDPWEPFYITATDTMPRYDERFRQYGFNRISKVCEAHVSGHLFVVLSPVFVWHRGLKEKGRNRATKELEQHRNRLHFRQFKQELKLRYPLSNRGRY